VVAVAVVVVVAVAASSSISHGADVFERIIESNIMLG
jgi:hypothetical protein